jgi:hypothetical protein
VQRLALAAALAAAAVVALLPAASAASPRVNPLSAAERDCGLPQKYPLWIDFGDGSVPFWDMFAKPGLVSGAANFVYPSKIRALGGHTIYFDLNFHRRLGSPSKPVDTQSVIESANRLFYYASASSGCQRPWIGLNELFGASLPTPWSQTNALYRSNVLTFVKILADHGAHVFLFVNSSPYGADEAGDWWREVAKYTDFVREVYFASPVLYQQGPVLAGRTLRRSFRNGVLEFTQLGIPVSKVGIFLGFQTEKGNGGREGLARLAWFRTIKWQVLAARQVSRELKFATIWSWGWGEWGGGSVDRDKPAAACVYLWTRDPRLCDGPKAAGRGFDTSLAEGQINLRRGVQCVVDGSPMAERAVLRLNALTHDPQVSFSAVFARAVAGRYARVTNADIRALERAVVATRFGGSFGAYRAALAREGAAGGVARGILGDELRRAQIESRIRAGSPSAAAVGAYYDEYGNLDARQVVARPAPWWLGDRRSGLAISTIAPDQVFRAPVGRWTTVRTASGVYHVRPLGPAAPLATFSLAAARPAIAGGLRQQAKEEAFESWIAAKERLLLKQTACRRDALPAVGAADLTSYLPFLAL